MWAHANLSRACLILVTAGATCVLDGCDQKPIVGPAVTIEPSDALPHQIGQFSSTEHAMIAKAGEQGALMFGPYASLTPGRYRAVFEISVAGPNGLTGNVDVNAVRANQPLNIVASTEIKPSSSHQRVALDFDAVADAKYEFRVISNGTSAMSAFGVVVKQHQ